MFKKLIIAAMAITFVFGSIGMTLAGDKGNKRKGKYTYRKVYKACNERGTIDYTKPHLSPDSKSQAEWTSVFKEKDFNQFKCKEEWENLSEKDLLDIYSYLHAHASDSPTPAKCK